MAVVALTQDSLYSALEESDTVIVDWWAEWCGPCKSFAPTFASASDKYPDVVFGKIDTEANAELATSAGIQSIPTIMAFRGGVLVFSQAGALPAEALDTLIQKVQAVDIDQLKAELEAEEAKQDADS